MAWPTYVKCLFWWWFWFNLKMIALAIFSLALLRFFLFYFSEENWFIFVDARLGNKSARLLCRVSALLHLLGHFSPHHCADPLHGAVPHGPLWVRPQAHHRRSFYHQLISRSHWIWRPSKFLDRPSTVGSCGPRGQVHSLHEGGLNRPGWDWCASSDWGGHGLLHPTRSLGLRTNLRKSVLFQPVSVGQVVRRISGGRITELVVPSVARIPELVMRRPQFLPTSGRMTSPSGRFASRPTNRKWPRLSWRTWATPARWWAGRAVSEFTVNVTSPPGSIATSCTVISTRKRPCARKSTASATSARC